MKFPTREFRRALETFEPPRPGEITFGIAARFLVHSKLASSRALHRYLFGYSTTELGSRIQGGLRVLHQRMPEFWNSPQEIIDGQTIYPLFRIFERSVDDARRVESILIRSRSSPGQRLRRLLELFPGAAWEKRQLPRYCIKCAQEEIAEGKQPTWYREHQIPGLNWCIRHNEYLCDFCYGCGDTLLRHSYLLPPEHLQCDHGPGQGGRDPAGRVRNKIRKQSLRSKDITTDDKKQIRMCEFAIALLEKNPGPIRPEAWLGAMGAEIKKQGLTKILRKVSGEPFFEIGRNVIRESLQPKPSTVNFLRLSIQDRLYLASRIFQSPDDMLRLLY